MSMTSMRFTALGAIAILAAVWVRPAVAGAITRLDLVATQAETQGDMRAAAGTSDCATPQRVITVKFSIGQDGHVQGPIDTQGLDIRTDADARRAVNAVQRSAPYAATYRGLRMTVQFRPKKTCAAPN